MNLFVPDVKGRDPRCESPCVAFEAQFRNSPHLRLCPETPCGLAFDFLIFEFVSLPRIRKTEPRIECSGYRSEALGNHGPVVGHPAFPAQNDLRPVELAQHSLSAPLRVRSPSLGVCAFHSRTVFLRDLHIRLEPEWRRSLLPYCGDTHGAPDKCFSFIVLLIRKRVCEKDSYDEREDDGSAGTSHRVLLLKTVSYTRLGTC